MKSILRDISGNKVIGVVFYVFLLLVPHTCFAQFSRAIVRVSANGRFAARIHDRFESGGVPFAAIMEYDSEIKCFSHVQKIQLPHKTGPADVIISDDGRYVVTIGNYSGVDDWSNAICIFDLAKEKNRCFALTDLFASEEISQNGRQGRRTSIVTPRGHEFTQAVLGDGERPRRYAFDQDQRLIWLTAKNNLAAGEEPGSSTAPTILIDLAKLAVRVENAPFWKAQHERLMALSEDRAERKREFLNTTGILSESEAVMVEMFDGFLSALSFPIAIEHQSLGNSWLCRIEPGVPSNGIEPSLIVMKYNSESLSFEKWRTTQLKNAILPQMTYLSSDARYLVTLDEHDSIGRTDNAIVIYNLEDGKFRRFSLEEFIPAETLKEIPAFGNIRLWRGPFTMEWIDLVGADFSEYTRWGGDAKGLHVEVDVRSMQVHLIK